MGGTSSKSEEITSHSKPRNVAFAYSSHSAAAKVQEVPYPPMPGPNQMIIKVVATSLNPADWKSAGGGQAALLSFAWPRVYGFDFSGEVHQLPNGENSEFKVGDKVFGMIRGLPELHKGTLANYCLVDQDICARCPENIPHNQCASLPLVAITAVMGFEACGLSTSVSAPGPRVLVLGGAGGVGTAAIQIAKNVYNASYIATTASPGPKTKLVTSLGADQVVNYREEKFEEVLEAASFDAILDCTDEAARAVNLLKVGGAMCSILASPTVEAIRTWLASARVDPKVITTGVSSFLHCGAGGTLVNFFGGASSMIDACKAKGATFAHVIGTGNGEIMKQLAGWMADGKVIAVIDTEFELSDAQQAVDMLKAGRTAGKIIVNITSTPETTQAEIESEQNENKEKVNM